MIYWQKLGKAISIAAATFCGECAALAESTVEKSIEFNRDVRPILSDHCFPCHGPDQGKRQGDLRLDLEMDAKAKKDDVQIIVPGDVSQSELFRRVASSDPSEKMPPIDSGHQLDSHQIEILRKWISQGAAWQKHWAFIPPSHSAFPVAKNSSWVRNGIDSFVAQRHEREVISPNIEADKSTLIRRVTFDLTGIPPTLEEIDAYLSDDDPNAYEKLVDRLLSSPRYGERMATRWLDAARYADTNGYQSDGERSMWRWRDWVIDAFNANMPFDQFTLEQLAGDLLSHPTLEQRIATGFNRNHRGNGEGGIVPEEYAVEYVVDRVDTTATVWLGLTMGCVRCHDHKFDPFTQEEYYKLFAYFNNIPERGKAVKFGNSPPLIRAPTRLQQKELESLRAKLNRTESEYATLQSAIQHSQRDWELLAQTKIVSNWNVRRELNAHFALDEDSDQKPSPVGRAAYFDGAREVSENIAGDYGFYDKFTLSAWVQASNQRGGTVLSRMTDVEEGSGYSVRIVNGHLEVALVKRWLDDAIRVRTQRVIAPGVWYHVAVVYDGSRFAPGVKVYIDGVKESMEFQLDDLNQSFQSKEPFRIGAGHGPDSRFHGWIDDVSIFNAELSPTEVAILSVPETIAQIIDIAPNDRSDRQRHKLHACFLESHAPKPISDVYQELYRYREELRLFQESLPTTMVMEENPIPRETHVLIRGVYHDRGKKVTPAIPAKIALPLDGMNSNRLGLAKWIVNPNNPLTARVAVNRIWQLHFGTGLVKTVDDFGSQGEWPSHPELLDWLATNFTSSGWDVKGLQTLILCSSTYRQSSRQSSRQSQLHQQRDPENRLLSSGPHARHSAEMIRDSALAVSGLLAERIGGQSVKPYQPDGLWKELSGEDYKQDMGESLYRRSLYTYWKRTNAPPSMITLDAAGREACIVRESRTNTPLQALTLMNDVTFVEAARGFAERMIREGGHSLEERLRWGFRLCLSRHPKDEELTVLIAGVKANLEKYRDDTKSASELIKAGESMIDAKLDLSELAAFTVAASLMLNLDESITKR